jgi:hypothetical protein
MRFYIHMPLPCAPLPVTKRHVQTADKGRTAGNGLSAENIKRLPSRVPIIEGRAGRRPSHQNLRRV